MKGLRTKGCYWTWLFLSGFCSGYLLRAAEPESAAYERATRAVVQLLGIGPLANGKNREGGGTGFLVNEDGYIVTNAHVFQEAHRCLGGPVKKIIAKLSVPGPTTARAVSCDLVGLDDLHDLAVIKTERPLSDSPAGPQQAFLFLNPSDESEGVPVAVTGHPLFAWRTITLSGRVIRRERLRLSGPKAEPVEVLILDIPLHPGSSGSPVYFVTEGSVIAVVEGQARLHSSETVAVPIRYAIELLNRYDVKWYARSLGGSHPTAFLTHHRKKPS